MSSCVLIPEAQRLGRFLDLTNLDSRTIYLIQTAHLYLDERAHDLIRAHKKRMPLRPLSTSQKTILPDVTIDYDALPSKRSIRLLELQHSTIFNGPIVTTLQTYNLDEAPPFRALSYTWGKPYHDIYTEDVEEPSKFAATIWCNEKKTPVTQNLLDALKSLNNLDITGLIWIDALCINQQDSAERASQVPLMGDIYSLASEVLVWLGPYTEAADDFLWATTDFLKLIADDQNPGKPKETYSQGNLGDPDFWSSLKMEDPVERLLSFTEFYHSCRWFTRVWTVQEVILAQRTRMFCGETELSLQNSQDLLSILDTLDWTRELLNSFSEANISLNRRFFVELSALRHLGGIVHQTTLTYDEEARSRWEVGAERCIILSKILFSCRSHFCQDPRDKVYAALAMINDSESRNPIAESITANYTIPVETVFTEVTALILEHSKYLDIISDTRHQEHEGDQGTRIDFPSWAHDFSVRFVASSLVLTDPSFDAALCETSDFPPFKVDGGVIECQGAYFDTVTEVQATGLELLMLGNRQSIIDFIQLYMALELQIQGLSRLEVLWRSLTIDPRSRANDHSLAPSFTAWLQVQLASMLQQASARGDEAVTEATSIIDGMLATGSTEEIAIVQKVLTDDLPSLIDMPLEPEQTSEREMLDDYFRGQLIFYDSLYDVLELRRLCITAKGFLAVGVDTVQKNDQVWLLTDAHTPVILRPTDIPGSFRIVGDCYIHGFMHGEMLNEKWGVKQNIGSIKII